MPKTSAIEATECSFGTKQLSDLLSGIKNRTLYATAGKKWKTQSLGGKVAAYIRESLSRESTEKARRELRTVFDYLRLHRVQTTEEEAKVFQEQLDVDFGLCRPLSSSGEEGKKKAGETHPQLKIPDSRRPPQSDRSIGVLQIQAYTLASLMQGVNTDEQLMKALENEIKSCSAGTRVTAHLCKRTCTVPKHLLRVPSGVNIAAHETCPAYWLVRGHLHSFCSCPGEQRCLAPGPRFDAVKFQQSLFNAMEDVIKDVRAERVEEAAAGSLPPAQ